MEWKKTSISGAELERQQQAYIKEALEMAKRSVTSQFGSSDKNSVDDKAAVEKAAAEKNAAEKAAAEKIFAEKAAAEKAAAEKIAAEKAAAERITAEKAAAEKIAAEKAAAEKIAAERAAAEKIAAEKAAEKIAAEKAAEKIAAEKAAEKTDENNTINIFEEDKEDEELTQFSPITEEKTECEAPKIVSEEIEQSGEPDIIDIAQIKKENFTKESDQAQISSDPPNFNNYINQHNKARCNCPNCQRKRQQQ